MAAKKRPGRKVSSQLAGSPLNYPGTMNGVGKMIGTLPAKVGPQIKEPPGPKAADVNEPELSGGHIVHGKIAVKPKKKPKHVKVKRY
jgi:hypothetical protein